MNFFNSDHLTLILKKSLDNFNILSFQYFGYKKQGKNIVWQKELCMTGNWTRNLCMKQ